MLYYNMSFFKKICDWFKDDEKLTEDDEKNVILNQNLLDLRSIYRNSRIEKFKNKEIQSNKYLNELIKIKWLEECKLAANNAYIGIYFNNKLNSSDLYKLNKFLISIFGENIKIRACCYISIIWGTNNDEICEANFGDGCRKFSALKFLKIKEEDNSNIGLII